MLVINDDDHEERGATQEDMQESYIARKLQQSLSPSTQSTRRKSCGKILDVLGEHCPGDGEATRQSTFKTETN